MSLNVSSVKIYFICYNFQKCTLNNCPVEIKFKVDNIIKEFNTNSSEKVGDGIDDAFTDKENHKDNNVSLLLLLNLKTQHQQITKEYH